MRGSSLGERIVPAEVKAHRFVELDSLRGVAASAVVFGHFYLLWSSTKCYMWIQRSPLRICFAGHEAVVLFFMLSGFVLCIPLSGDCAPSYRIFLMKRFCRIYLPYLAAILVAATCDFFLYSTIPTGDTWVDQTWSMRPTLGLVVGHLLTTTRHPAQLNSAIWSLIVEIRVSMIFPVLFWVVRRARPVLLLGICAVLSGVLPLLPHGNSIAEWTISPDYLALFAGGILLWLHLPQVSHFLMKIGGKWRGVVLLLSLLCIIAPHSLDSWRVAPVSRSIFDLEDYVIGAGAAGLIACAIQAGALRSMLNHPVLVRLGALSYSTYLMHPTVSFVLIRLFYGRFPFYYLLPVYLAGVYVASEVFHKFVDQPSVMLGRRVGRRQKQGAQAPA
jgi:peptidoglycan/LPS O-acetylase OafA/YrhL